MNDIKEEYNKSKVDVHKKYKIEEIFGVKVDNIKYGNNFTIWEYENIKKDTKKTEDEKSKYIEINYVVNTLIFDDILSENDNFEELFIEMVNVLIENVGKEFFLDNLMIYDIIDNDEIFSGESYKEQLLIGLRILLKIYVGNGRKVNDGMGIEYGQAIREYDGKTEELSKFIKCMIENYIFDPFYYGEYADGGEEFYYVESAAIDKNIDPRRIYTTDYNEKKYDTTIKFIKHACYRTNECMYKKHTFEQYVKWCLEWKINIIVCDSVSGMINYYDINEKKYVEKEYTYNYKDEIKEIVNENEYINICSESVVLYMIENDINPNEVIASVVIHGDEINHYKIFKTISSLPKGEIKDEAYEMWVAKYIE